MGVSCNWQVSSSGRLFAEGGEWRRVARRTSRTPSFESNYSNRHISFLIRHDIYKRIALYLVSKHALVVVLSALRHTIPARCLSQHESGLITLHPDDSNAWECFLDEASLSNRDVWAGPLPNSHHAVIFVDDAFLFPLA